MERYVDPADGAAFEGVTARGVVRAMWHAAWRVPPGKGAYMRAVARRVAFTHPGAVIDPSSSEAFLASLVTAGLLRKES